MKRTQIITSMRPSFFHHLHPPTIPAAQARWRHTLGAGGTAVFLMFILGITGALEMFYYVPKPEDAARSIQTIAYLVPFGGLIRNLHFWSAQILMLVSLVHLVRVIFTGAYIPPRRFNYLLGLALFVLSVFLNFTGYVLRWDEGIQWALVVGTNLLKTIPLVGDALYRIVIGGAEPNSATLVRFYAWHVFMLVSIAAFFLGWHIFRVRRDGGIATPPPSLRLTPARITRFELLNREAAALLLTTVGLILLSLFFPAPISAPIRLSVSQSVTDSAAAPWFFLWIQTMLKWGDPFLFGILIPFALLMILALIPYLFPKIDQTEIGTWFPKSNRLAQITTTAILLLILILTLVNR